MGRASRAKRERKLVGPADAVVIDSLTPVDYKNKIWSLSAIRRLIPAGTEPIATRYDPLQHCLHVACADGRVHIVSWTDAEKAERDANTEREGPVILDPKTMEPWEVEAPPEPPLKFHEAYDFIAQAKQAAEAIRVQRKIAEQAKRDAMERVIEQQEQQQQQRERQQQKQEQPDSWEVARARCAELEIKLGKELLCACPHGRVQGCHGKKDPDKTGLVWTACDRHAEVAMIKAGGRLWRDIRDRYPVACEQCARALMMSKRAKLDSDPDADTRQEA